MTFEKIIGHRKKGRKNEVKVLWEDDTESWEPLSVMATEDPVTLANYGHEQDILHQAGWKRFRPLVNMKKSLTYVTKKARSK